MGYYSSLLIRVDHIVYIISIIGLGLNFELVVSLAFSFLYISGFFFFFPCTSMNVLLNSLLENHIVCLFALAFLAFFFFNSLLLLNMAEIDFILKAHGLKHHLTL